MIPGVGSAPVPAAVRQDGGQDAYRTALGFEGLLLDRLSEQLTQAAGLDGSPYGGSVAEAASSALLQGGGLGLAEQLYAALRAAR